jgi:hypothetical protein
MPSFCRRSLMHSFFTLDASDPKFWPAKTLVSAHLITAGSSHASQLTHFQSAFHGLESLLQLVVTGGSDAHDPTLFSDGQPGIQRRNASEHLFLKNRRW